MSTRKTLHDLVDDLADEDLEPARRALEEIRDGEALTPEQIDELRERLDAANAPGGVVDAWAFLAALRDGDAKVIG